MKSYRLSDWKAGGHFEDVPDPEPGPGEVRIRLGGAGICHSDIHLMHEWTPENMPSVAHLKPPFTLGHENAGWIDALGSGVSGWEVGEPVVATCVWGCGYCAHCRIGFDNYCETHSVNGGGLGYDGGLASHMVCPARQLIRLRNLHPKEAAPLTDAGLTSYHAVKHTRPWLTPDSAALIIGVGGLGHMGLAYLREIFGGTIIAVDSDAGARAMAADRGADIVLESNDDTAAAIRDATEGLGVRAAFDFVGVQATMDLAAALTRSRGRIVLIGLGGGSLSVGLGKVAFDTTVSMPLGGSTPELAEVVALAENGRVLPHVTEFAFNQIEEAYEKLHHGQIEGRAVILPE
jgi:propanol-preferring alcohol dehydrogenase